MFTTRKKRTFKLYIEVGECWTCNQGQIRINGLKDPVDCDHDNFHCHGRGSATLPQSIVDEIVKAWTNGEDV